MVEFALVAPLFFLVFFGFVEFALINASIAGYNFAAKDGARIGSLLGRTDSTVDTQIVTDIRVHVAGIVMAQPVEIEIFKADEGGNEIGTVENAYDINGNPIGTPSWPVDNRNDTLLDADYLGVRITFQYTYLTSYVSGGNASLTLTANSVQRIEPQDYQGSREHGGEVARLMGAPLPTSSASSHSGSLPPGNALFASTSPVWIRSRDAEATV
ncbi:MAG: TadE/TadG family type IV pilus assembly protein [Ktedonobacterales bacterium]